MNKEYAQTRIIEIEYEIANMELEREKLIAKIKNMLDSVVISQLDDRIKELSDMIQDKMFILNTIRLYA
ncbi:TPA: hypothetical protein LAG04_001598 [Escherichia coli]|uniref:hypothetical protein n=1 Tax=Escherichia coli TaxID=562 RepID=UPI00108092EE|nr:hypothetical protein [Escherichia coli]ELA6140487.1 hypothetical protein [Shigella sonnei]EEZ1009359.1 hypothetical protein [Escherichia coli]TGF80884.1 hypothetical protein DAH36_16470 [Escherichia coli]HAY4689417.1 hypothetical protein [Escherichia coli]HBI9868517.1 hypothetical protein [Escherichia coli]